MYKLDANAESSECLSKILWEKLRDDFKARWSDRMADLLTVESFTNEQGENIAEILRLAGAVITLEAEWGVSFYFGERMFSIKSRQYELARTNERNPDLNLATNLTIIKAMLPENAKALYLGGGNQRAVTNAFGSNAVNMSDSADFLSPGDVRGDGQKMPFKSDSFDMLMVNYVSLADLQNPILVAEIRRVLKDGGLLFCPQNTGFNEELISWLGEAWGPIRRCNHKIHNAMAMAFLCNDGLEFEEVDKGLLVDGEVMVLLRIRKNIQ